MKLMEDKQAVLVLQTDTASYTLPASQIQIDSVAEQLELNSNDSLESIKLQVEICSSRSEYGGSNEVRCTARWIYASRNTCGIQRNR